MGYLGKIIAFRYTPYILIMYCAICCDKWKCYFAATFLQADWLLPITRKR